MTIEKYQHRILFYSLSTIISWLFWFIAAWLSHQIPTNNIYKVTGSILGILGLVSPMVIAFIMMCSNSDLRKDLSGRLFKFKKTKSFYLFITCGLMLTSILLAQAISLLFGYSTSQFGLSGSFSFSYSLFPPWFLLILAPILEELAWHSYGTDCLRARFNLFTTSLIFAVFWALWHFPLSFIKDYYHSNLVEAGLIYSLNFYFSLIPFVLLMNWLYFKTGRNILVAIVFHITASIFNEIFTTHPMSKVIQTLLLIALSIFLVIKERDFFFNRDYREAAKYNENNLELLEDCK